VARYAAFLRAINIGGRRLANDALRAPFEDLGLEDVRTFQAAGNVVFAAPREAADKLTKRVERALEKGLGYDVGVFLRTPAQVREIGGNDPFPKRAVKASKGKLQVLLLGSKPSAATRKKVLALATAQDLLAFGGRELYWLPSGGTLESELDRKAIDKLLGPGTNRTQGTIQRMAAKYFEDG
jgi:uncharacterized protein (DUF1697 family)